MAILQSTKNEWLTRRECLRLLECTHPTFSALVASGRVRRREGCGYRQYFRKDVEKIAAPPKPAA